MIEVNNLVKRYGSQEVLHDISLVVRPGEATGYLGPNGAGKSTTVKIVAGLLRPDEGQVRVCGYDLARDPLEVKRRIGYVPESAALFSTLTPHEYFSLLADLYDLDNASAAERAWKLLKAFDILEAAGQQIDTLSKGMRQKVLLIGAILHDPEVLLLDEPLNGLDVNAVLMFRRIVEGLLARGKTVLFCSHLLDVVERLCTRVIIIDHGRIVADDTTANLLAGQPRGTLESVFQSLTRSEASEASANWIQALVDGPPGPVPSPPK